jgi:hypothetical protein
MNAPTITDEKHDNDMIIMTKRFSSRKKGRTSIEFTI